MLKRSCGLLAPGSVAAGRQPKCVRGGNSLNFRGTRALSCCQLPSNAVPSREAASRMARSVAVAVAGLDGEAPRASSFCKLLVNKALAVGSGGRARSGKVASKMAGSVAGLAGLADASRASPCELQSEELAGEEPSTRALVGTELAGSGRRGNGKVASKMGCSKDLTLAAAVPVELKGGGTSRASPCHKVSKGPISAELAASSRCGAPGEAVALTGDASLASLRKPSGASGLPCEAAVAELSGDGGASRANPRHKSCSGPLENKRLLGSPSEAQVVGLAGGVASPASPCRKPSWEAVPIRDLLAGSGKVASKMSLSAASAELTVGSASRASLCRVPSRDAAMGTGLRVSCQAALSAASNEELRSERLRSVSPGRYKDEQCATADEESQGRRGGLPRPRPKSSPPARILSSSRKRIHSASRASAARSRMPRSDFSGS